MEKKGLSKRTKILFWILGAIVVIAAGFFVWLYFGGGLKSEAAVLNGKIYARAVHEKAPSVGISGVHVGIIEGKVSGSCTTGVDGKCLLNIYGPSGNYKASFVKIPYVSVEGSNYCGFFPRKECTIVGKMLD